MATGNGGRINVIDKNHGFMKFIIKNQIERDNYDKEQKRSEKSHGKEKKHKTQVQPIHQTTSTQQVQTTVEIDCNEEELDEVPSKLQNLSIENLLFNLEFLTNDGSVIKVPVKEEDQASLVVKRITEQYPLDKTKQNLLTERVKKEIKKFRRRVGR